MEGNVPKSFEIFGQTITVVFVDNLARERDVDGEAHHRLNEIRIQKNTNGNFRTDEQIDETFWHEVTHVILEKLQYHKLNNDEQFVGRFGSALQQVIKTSKY